MSLSKAIKAHFPNANSNPFTGNFLLETDKDGIPRIIRWDERVLGPRPSSKELEQIEAAYIAHELTPAEKFEKTLGYSIAEIKSFLS